MVSRYSIWKRPQFLFTFLGLILAFYFLFFWDDKRLIGSDKKRHSTAYPSPSLKIKVSYQDDQYKQQACQFPKMELNDPSILELMGKERLAPLDCTRTAEGYPLLFDSFVEPYPRLVPVGVAIPSKKAVRSCCFREINFGQDPEFSKQCWKVNLLDETVIPEEHEYIAIECEFLEGNKSKIVDMHAFIHVEKKSEGEGKDKLNVIVLGIDSMSRMNFQRTFPETRDYLMNKLDAVEMEGLNKIGDNTFPNIGVLLTNQFISDDYHTSCLVNGSPHACNFLWSEYSAKGYQSLFTEDEYTMSMEDLFMLGNASGKAAQAPDVYFLTFLSLMEKHIGHQRRISANFCLGPRSSFQKSMDYMKKMAIVTRKSGAPFFQFAWYTALTHDFLTGGSLVDKDLKLALQWYHEQSLLENTLLIVMSDHGSRIGGIRGVHQGQLEDRMPFLFAVLPAWWKEMHWKAYENLKNNRKRLITVWDVHQTLRHILEPEALQNDNLSWSVKGPGKSLFLPVPLSRTCEEAGVPSIYCTCNYQVEPVSINDTMVIHAVSQVIDEINDILEPQPLCAQLSLRKIFKGSRVSFKDISSSSWQAYSVVFDTIPTWTTFDALVVQEGDEGLLRRWVPRNIGRSTWYWLDQKGTCLDESREKRMIKIYCYCKQQENN